MSIHYMSGMVPSSLWGLLDLICIIKLYSRGYYSHFAGKEIETGLLKATVKSRAKK